MAADEEHETEKQQHPIIQMSCTLQLWSGVICSKIYRELVDQTPAELLCQEKLDPHSLHDLWQLSWVAKRVGQPELSMAIRKRKSRQM